jgi:hypothetical protein
MSSTLTPSAKAGVEPLPPGSESCGCCDGVDTATPKLIDNRGGLSAVDYRIGHYADWQASLTAGLSQGGTPELAPLTALLTRDSRDFTIGLIDAFSCAADVLTFYQERIANESWLRTCTERVSLQEQGRLIGYRLKPGVAAEAWLAFAVETPPTPPAAMKPEPGSFVSGVPETVTLATGLRVNSVPGPDEKPQAFETVEPLAARWPWNAMRAMPDEERVPGFGARETWLAGTSTQLKAGDMLVFVGPQFDADPASNRWDRRVLTAVEPDDAHQRTRVAWQEPLGSVTPLVRPADPPLVLAMRERAAIFGHNAPDWSSMSAEFKAAYLGLSAPRQLKSEHLGEWPNFDIYAPGGTGFSITAHTTALDAAAVLQDTLRAAGLQQARSSAIAAGQILAGGAQFVERIAALPAETAGAWLGVANELPSVLADAFKPVADLAQRAGDVGAAVTRVSALEDTVRGLEDAVTRLRG